MKISIQKLTRFFFNFKIWHFAQFSFRNLTGRKILFKIRRVVTFLIQKLIFCSFSGSSIKQLKEKNNKRSWLLVFAWYLVQPVYLLVFSVILGPMMVLITISFALPILVFETLCLAKVCKFTNIFFQQVLKSDYIYHNHLGNTRQFL